VTATATPLLDPADPAFRADPYPTWRALREGGSVRRLEDTRDWIVTGYREVRTLLRDPRTGYAGAEPEPAPTTDIDVPFVRARAKALSILETFMHRRAPEDHKRLRRVARPALNEPAAKARRARMEELVDASVERALANGGMDVIADLARPLAVTIAAELVGIPAQVRSQLDGWGREMTYWIEIWPTPVERERGILAMASLAPRLREISPESGTILAALRQANADGQITEDEAISHAALFFLAAHVTTVNLIGNGLLALVRNPNQWQLLRERPAAIASAVEELLRFDTPGPAIKRRAREDIEVGPHAISRGDLIVLSLAAANRDPAAFPEPDRLDLTRSPNPHLSFGHDAHYCLGAAFARLEAQIAIGTLARSVARIRLATEEPEREDWFVVRGLKSLPIEFA